MQAHMIQDPVIQASVIDGGFTDPVFASQRAFRVLMDAFAQPGTVADLGGLAGAPAPLDPATAAILLTLADADTPVFFEDAGATGTAIDWLAFHTGARACADRKSARFAVLGKTGDPAGWRGFELGTSDYPDRSVTLLLPVGSLEGGADMVLSGPGIETRRHIAPAGLPEGFAQALTENRARFPLGFDLVLVAGHEALALPRTTRISEV